MLKKPVRSLLGLISNSNSQNLCVGVLAALAYGYYRGGQQATSNFSTALVRNLLCSLCFFGIGLSYSFTNFFFLLAAKWSVDTPLAHPLFHLLIYCVIVLCPLVFWLGQTVPLLLNTADNKMRKSEAAGNATALSTIGNVVGCLLTSLCLMYFLGVGYSIFVNCLILFVCLGLVLDWSANNQAMYVAATAITVLAITFSLNVTTENHKFIAATPFGNYSIKDAVSGRRFVINRSNASFLSTADQKGWPYIELIKQGVLSADMSGKDVLVLGAGGFTLTAEGSRGANVTYLDIDPGIKHLAESQFLMGPIKGQFIAQDARSFLLYTRKKWDVIVVDLYSNAATIPMHTSTYEFFSLINSRLSPKGKVALNIVANPTLKDDYSLNMDLTVRQSFSRCLTNPTAYRDELVNIIYFCTSLTGDEIAAEVYRDNTNRVAVEGFLSHLQAKPWESGTGHDQ